MDVDFCLKTSSIWQFVGYAIYVIKIIIPIVLIIMGIVELSKCVVSGKDDEIKSTFTKLLKKVIIAVLIFFVPTITRLVFNMISAANESMVYSEGCITCMVAPFNETCKNAVSTAKEARASMNYELYNTYYEFVKNKHNQKVDHTGENSGGNPGEKPSDGGGSGGTTTPAPPLTGVPEGATSHTFIGADGKTKYDYWLMVPKNARKNLPLIVYLHGGTSSDYPHETMITKEHPAIDVVNIYGDNYPFIMLIPHSPSSWYSGTDDLNNLISEVAKEYSVNTNKIIISGASNGGAGTWKFALAYPSVPSALYIISGPYTVDTSNGSVLKDINIKGIGETINNNGNYYQMMANMCTAVNSFNGSGSCEIEAKPDERHWTILNVAFPKSIFEWMISQSK